MMERSSQLLMDTQGSESSEKRVRDNQGKDNPN
jgi:hypothetical protein